MAVSEELEDRVVALDLAMGEAATMTAAFEGELGRMRDQMLYTGREVGTMSRSIGSGLRRAFDGVVFDGLKLSDALKDVARSMADAAYSAAMKPVQNALGGQLPMGSMG